MIGLGNIQLSMLKADDSKRDRQSVIQRINCSSCFDGWIKLGKKQFVVGRRRHIVYVCVCARVSRGTLGYKGLDLSMNHVCLY